MFSKLAQKGLKRAVNYTYLFMVVVELNLNQPTVPFIQIKTEIHTDRLVTFYLFIFLTVSSYFRAAF